MNKQNQIELIIYLVCSNIQDICIKIINSLIESFK